MAEAESQYREPTHEDTAVHVHKPVHPQQNRDIWRFTAELIRTAIVVGILAFVIRSFVIQPFVVEGSSMFPRFQTNDFLIVDKLSYRIHRPERGDIIVFKYPFDMNTNYVKRIIGLPGETVSIHDGTVTIKNNVHPEGALLSEPYLATDVATNLPGGANSGEFVVPDTKYFVLGDNRKASSDSREWGFLPSEDITGRVFVQAFPFARASWVAHARYTGL
jgi:signal peptidase I